MLNEKEIEKLPWRGRGLKQFLEKFGDIDDVISNGNHPLRILEIGTGYGQLLIDLASKYGSKVQLFGINKEFESIDQEKAVRIAEYKRAIPSDFALSENQITFDFSDIGSALPYPDHYFDIVVSQVCIAYVNDKLNALMEVARVLKTAGIAKLHAEFEYGIPPDTNDAATTLKIINNNKSIDLNDFFSAYKNISYVRRLKGSVMEIKGGELLDFNAILSHVEPVEDKEMHGIKSIYYLTY